MLTQRLQKIETNRREQFFERCSGGEEDKGNVNEGRSLSFLKRALLM